jgi:hypothetical protein
MRIRLALVTVRSAAAFVSSVWPVQAKSTYRRYADTARG